MGFRIWVWWSAHHDCDMYVSFLVEPEKKTYPLDRHFARNESGLQPSIDSSVEDYYCYPHPPTLMAVFGYCFMKCMRYNLSQATACFVTP